ncbi:18151_t:CDS:2, partial [Entrophospora sp. SA101]
MTSRKKRKFQEKEDTCQGKPRGTKTRKSYPSFQSPMNRYGTQKNDKIRQVKSFTASSFSDLTRNE